MRFTRPPALCALLLALLASLPTPTEAQEQAASLEPGVRPGDRVEIQMFTSAGEAVDVVAGTRTVDRDGRLFLPFLGSIAVEGMGASEIRELLERRYADIYSEPVIDVETQLRINVTGSVRSPGNYYVEPTSTLIDVVATAGGITSEVDLGTLRPAADPSEVRLVRQGETRVLDLRPEQVDSATLTIRAQSGDWIHVPTRERSELRANIQFIGSIASVAASILTLIILAGR